MKRFFISLLCYGVFLCQSEFSVAADGFLNQNNQQIGNQQALRGNAPAQPYQQAAQNFAQGQKMGILNNPPAVNQPQNFQRAQGALQSQPGQAQGRNERVMKPSGITLLSTHPDCREDILRICGEDPKTNFKVMECLLDKRKQKEDINDKCEHVIWQYKKNITVDERFDTATENICKNDIAKLTECSQLAAGQKMACVMEHKMNITSAACKKFVTRMEMIAFSDYRLVYRFTADCGEDIEKHQCGRFHAEGDNSPHSQGKTLECLTKQLGNLADQCKHQILRLAELQSEDYHLDRPLYYACRDDREKVCKEIRAGSGQVLNCLLQHKFDRVVSEECREQLTHRQQLMAVDVRVNRGLFVACQSDIAKYQCLDAQRSQRFREARQALTVLCLEGALRDEKPLTGDCTYALRQTRKSLLADYQINPEVVASCSNVISSNCNGMDRGGKTLHCLMRVLKRNKDDVPAECQRALEGLIEEADPGEDYEVDPTLKAACQSTADIICQNHKPEDIMSCLMQKIDHDQMKEECQQKLLEVQFFIARRFKLDRSLYKECKKSAADLCGADDRWHKQSTTPDRGPTIFACLYSNLKLGRDSTLEPNCKKEMWHVLEERAVSVNLNPRIQRACMEDLGYYCQEGNEGLGKEMACLQKNIANLENECKEAVKDFIQDEGDDVKMDREIIRYCRPVMTTVCKDYNSSEMMKCLIKNKHTDNIDSRCTAAITHYQIVSSSANVFSRKFKQACQEDRDKHCQRESTKKGVISCISMVIRDDAISGKEPPSVSEDCRKQLVFEVQQMTENVQLDKDFFESCKADADNYCSDIKPGGGRLRDCLRRNREKLSTDCKQQLFKREEIVSALGPKGDFSIYSKCKRMIKVHCQDSSKDALFNCLLEHKKDDQFDARCKEALVQSLRVRAKDIQLNVGLYRSCKSDIGKYCGDELKTEQGGEIMKSRVMTCLRVKFSQRKLTQRCEQQLAGLVREAALDYKQDPGLARECSSEVRQYCASSIEAENMDDQGQVQECLKENLKKGRITNVRCIKELARVLAENKADVHTDPILYRTCSNDLNNLCKDVVRGEGRQMSCLLNALDEHLRLQPACKKLLTERKQMWEKAAEQAPPETLKEVFQNIADSPERNYLLTVLFSVVGVIFVVGLCCGRATKRMIRQQIKNK